MDQQGIAKLTCVESFPFYTAYQSPSAIPPEACCRYRSHPAVVVAVAAVDAADVVDAAVPFEVAVVVVVDEWAFHYENVWNSFSAFVVAYRASPAHRSYQVVALHDADQWTLAVSFDHDEAAYPDAFVQAVPDEANEEAGVPNNHLVEAVADSVAFQTDRVEPEMAAAYERVVVQASLVRTLDSLDADEAFLAVRSYCAGSAWEVSSVAFVGRSAAVPSHRRVPSWCLLFVP